jgi:hypothetical protein
MNEQEISALVDEVLRGKQAQRPAEAPKPEADPAPAAVQVVSHAAEPDDEPAPAPAPQDPAPAAEPPEPAAAPGAEERRSRLYAALDAQPERKPAPAPKQKYRTRDLLTGLLLVALALFGVYALIVRIRDHAAALRASDPAKEAAKACILPLVITDLPEFSDPGELSDDQFLTAAIWAAVTEGKLAQYEESFGLCSVPVSDLTALGNRLFGVNRSPAYHTIGFSGELRFYYDAEAGCYMLPADPELFTYEPEIREMTQNADGLYTVTADYLAEQPAWKQTAPQTVKTMVFTLAESGGNWQVRAAKLRGGESPDENSQEKDESE